MDSLVEELAAVRHRAGEPSLDALVRLLKEQRNPMGRSTIGNKLNGTSRLKLHELLAFVRAFAVYASQRDIPLSAEDIDEDVWRKRFEAVPRARTAEPTPAADMPLSVPEPVRARRQVDWDLQPLNRAQMHDLVDYVEANSGDPMDQWLPHVLGVLARAGMAAVDQFLVAAVDRPIPELVDLVEALLLDENDTALDGLLKLCALRLPPEDFPGLLVELRRSESDGALMLSGDLVPAIPSTLATSWDLTVLDGAVRILAIAKELREATMFQDSQKLVEALGRGGYSSQIVEALSILPDDQRGDWWTILSFAGTAKPRDVVMTLQAIDKSAAIRDKGVAMEALLRAVPKDRREEVRSLLEAMGLGGDLNRLWGLDDSDPF